MDALALSYIRQDPRIDVKPLADIGSQLEAQYRAHKAQYDDFQGSRSDLQDRQLTGREVRLASVFAVASIKTQTAQIDADAGAPVSGDFAGLRDFLRGTRDGRTKWSRVSAWYGSDMPDRVAELLNRGYPADVNDAHALLAGRDPDTGESAGETYMRTCKGAFALYLLGYDRMCVDTRVFRALRPAFGAVLRNKDMTHPETELDNPYRASTPRMDAKPVPVLSHSGAGDGRSFWEDKLKFNPREYHAVTRHVWLKLAEHADVPVGLIPQLAFNTEGDTTTHETLMDLL